ncbi:VPEID-CTERM sorting domain-containing protein [Candidatus Methylomicrobium oryzae]|jgi:hypothetical protein|uniref:VPEID-CTERM sorting domain-containing protein n=1 Tax=Candidatus Methylomicrobium oryzae TaxID=2802053 RepID=UPI0019207AE6|nr:VPEID-CTERM sorting domain-containing protein [Methylomicrobium sp. RS1]MBL1264877.1 VPEID-CTERM sorting domain-containing protein [Methylomicrobium sp. RS1]
MKIRQKIIMGMTVILLTTGSPIAWSHPSPNSSFHNWKHSWSHVWSRFKSHGRWFHRGNKSLGINAKPSSGISKSHVSFSRTYDVPEIDATSGTSALALLTGVLLLASEKHRSKRR